MIADDGFAIVDGSWTARILRRLSSVAPLLVSLVVFVLLPTAGWAAPSVSTVSPAFGTNAGGTTVTLLGSGFTGATAVSFGGVPATALTIVNDGKLTVTTPAGATGPVSVTVTAPSGTNAVPATFRYAQLPVLTSVTPGGGPIAGGTVLTVSGSFLDTVTSATVAGNPVAITNLTPTSFNIVAPAMPAGSFRVIASNADGSSNILSFRYYPAPTITAMSPVSGAINGGTTVTVEGTDFYTGDVSTTVTINGVTRGGNLVGNKLTFQTPPSIAGPASVVITTASGSSAPANNLFTYIADPPTVTAVSPASGGTGGGTTVTLTGTNFGSMTSVTFNGTAATNLNVTSTTSMTVTAPPGTAGLAKIIANSLRGSGSIVASYTYVKPPAVTSISPNNDALAGGKTVTIQGANFTPDATVTIGGMQATGVVVSSPTSLTATVPPGSAGATLVTVSNVYGSGSLSNGFTYFGPPVVTSLSPNYASSAGNGVVTVNGTSFTAGSTVTVGGRDASVLSLTGSTRMSIRLPAGDDGPADVSVTTPYGAGNLVSGLTYYGSPTITAISPAGGGIAGATTITVTGTNFAPGTTLTIGSAAASAVTVVSPTRLTATLPAGTLGPADVKVTTPFGSAILGNGFTYLPLPTVTAISPSLGAFTGGSEVLISGTDFTDASKVTIGGLDVRSFTVVSPTQIKAIAPNGTVGPASVVVTTLAGKGTLANGFTYYGAPTVTSLSPTTGFYFTSTTVTLIGTNFYDVSSVTFAGYPCTDVVVVSPTEIRATAPPGRPRAVYVSVNTPAGRGTLPLSFTYVGVPVISAVTPAAAPYNGSTPITITGESFVGVTGVTIGGVPVSDFTIRSSTEMAMTVPAGTPGAQTIAITNSLGTGTLAGGFTRIGPPAISQVSPNRGPLAAGTTITVTGTNFIGVTGLSVGGAAVSSLTVDSPTQITATLPAGSRGAADVVVATASGQATAAGGFTYMGNPAVTGVSPNAGPYGGGTSVTLTCSSTDGLTGITIGGRSVSDLRILSPTQVSLTTPSGAAGTADIVVTTSYGPTTVPAGFTYIGPPVIGSVTPSEGPVAGGTTITINGTNLAGASGVTIGGVAATNLTVVSDQQITAKVPRGAAGAADVAVSTPSGTDRRPAAFTYIAVPVITAVTPATAPYNVSTPITITGESFIGITGVTIGGAAVSDFTVRSQTEIAATVPAGTPGAQTIAITNSLGTGTLAGGFTRIGPPAISQVSPNRGPLAAGTTITVTGTNFIGVTGLSVGGAAVSSLTVDSPTQITATLPAGSRGAADVVVATASGQATAAGGFTYMGNPAVTGVSPNAGPYGGGTSVVLTCSSTDGLTGITIGGRSVSDLRILSPTQVSLTTPSGAAGTADIVVTTSYGPTTVPAGFTYIGPPAIGSVMPSDGPVTGGATITITGTDLAGTSGVTIGGAPATAFTIVSDRQVTATVPPGTAGAADIALVTPSGTVRYPAAFTYVGIPVITAVSPASGAYSADIPVAITGTDFIGVTDVTVGGAAVRNLVVVSPTRITATVPAGTPGTQDIAITNGTGTGTQAAGFTRIGPPAISQVSPNRGPLAGGTTITVTGTKFIGVTGLTVGGAAVTGLTVNSPTEITAAVPAGTRGAADVVVATASGQATAAGGFTYMGNPAVTGVSPNAGPYGGGTSVTLTCSSTDGLTGITIGGRSVSDLRILSPTQVSLTTPPGAAGAADIVVTTSYGPTTVPAGFTYIGPPAIGSVMPSDGPVTGGATITITGTDLAGTSGVTIGGAPATAFTIVSDRQVTATVPPGTAGAADIALVTPSGTVRYPAAFTYRDKPRVTGLSRTLDDVAGGSVVSLTGSGLTGTTSVTVGGQDAISLRVVSDNEIAVTLPAGVPGPADVSVTTPWGTDRVSGAFVYTRLPSLTSLAPAEASIHGGAVVTLNGRNFVDVSGVTFNGVQAGNIHVLTPRQMTVVAPPGVLGPASVDVATADGHATLDGAFAYVDGPAPQITGLSVVHGPLMGGTTLIIRGEAFARASAVTFGGVPATRFEVIDDTSIRAVTPPSTPGSVDVDVTTLYGSGSLTSGFSYLAAPAIASILPANGPAAGGTPITITGTDFDDATAVTVGGAPATRFSVDSSSQITAVVPAGAPGMARVTVTTPSGTGEAAEGYTYVPPPVTIAITPANTVLPDAPQGGAYQMHFVANGGAAPYSFQLASGTLPAGLTLDGASGLLSGKPEEEDRTHAFELLVRDANGVSARGSYTLTVTRRQLTVQDKDVVVQAGFPPPDLRLDDGATGGPFTGATVAYVDPPAAGTASIIGAGATGADATWSLRFLPAADFAGTVRVGYRLAAMGVESNTGVITYHIGKSRVVAVQEVQAHEKSFLAMRQAMLDQGIHTPGLTDRRTARRADDGVKEEFTPSADGVHLGLSLDQRLGSEGEGEGVDFWARAALMLRQEPASEATGKPGSWGSFTLASAGADYLVSERLLLGMALHVHEASAPGSDGIDLSGKGWLAGPYASAELSGQTFLDVSLLYGQSANTIRSSAYRGSFDTSLWMLRGTLHGEMEIRDGLTLSPRLDVTYISEAVQDHLIHNPFGQTVAIPGFAEEQLRGSIGFDLMEEFRILGDIVVSPSLGVDIGYAGLDGDGVYASVKPGIGIMTPGGWNLIGGVQMSLAAGGDVIFGISGTASKRF